MDLQRIELTQILDGCAALQSAPQSRNRGIAPWWNMTNQMAASQMTVATAMTIQTKTRSRVLMRCGLGAGMDQGM